MEPYQEEAKDDLKTQWINAFDQTQRYREYLASLSINEEAKFKSYLISRQDIDDLLSQNGKVLDGIRIYIGHKVFENQEVAVRLIPVAVQKDAYGNFNDYNIPHKEDKDFLTRICSTRPCPPECSSTNDLNATEV